jgi:hypothetical protein
VRRHFSSDELDGGESVEGRAIPADPSLAARSSTVDSPERAP